jgi:hypothetical protein
MLGADIPSNSTAVIDTSILIAMGGPTNRRYQSFEQFVTRRGITVMVPGRVAEELGESPDAYMYQQDRLQSAQDAGWLTPGQIDFSKPRIAEVVDKTRKRMLNLSANDVTEDEIEKADTILAGITYQYATSGATHVTVFVSDTIAERAIDDVLSAIGMENKTMVVEGRMFLKELVDCRFE